MVQGQVQGSEAFAFVECRDISKAYRQGREKVQALERVSLKILPSRAVAVVGPSGCGKTTLLNIIGCLLAPDSGTLLIKGHEPKRTDKTRNSTFGYIRQDYALIGTETVGHNVSIPLEYAVPKVKRADRRSRVFSSLQKVGMEWAIHRKSDALSGGEQQRTAIARCLVNDPSIIIADEPTAALDHKNAADITGRLLSLAHDPDTPRALIVATHDMRLAEQCDSIITISDGKITGRQQIHSKNRQAAG